MNNLQELADEKGFFVLESDLSKNTKEYDYLYMCLLQKWLRDKHGIHIQIEAHSCLVPELFSYDSRIVFGKNENESPYEEALQEGLEVALNEIE